MKKIIILGIIIVLFSWLFSFSEREREFHFKMESSDKATKEIEEKKISIKGFNPLFYNYLEGKVYGTMDKEDFLYYVNSKGEVIKSEKKKNIDRLWKAKAFKNNNSIWINENLEINISNNKNSLKTVGKINLENFKDIEKFNYKVSFIDGTDKYGYIKVNKDDLSYDYIVDLDEEKIYKLDVNSNEILKLAYLYDGIFCFRENGDVSNVYIRDGGARLSIRCNAKEVKEILSDSDALVTPGALYGVILLNNYDKRKDVLAVTYDSYENKIRIIENEIEGKVVSYIENTNFIIIEKENNGKLDFFIAEIGGEGAFRLFRKINLEDGERIEFFSMDVVENSFILFTNKENLIILYY